MDNNFPIFDGDDPDLIKKLEVAFSDHSNVCNRDRPYIGQPHTYTGERGKQEVSGVTMRDIVDCFVMGALLSNGCDQLDLYNAVESDEYATQEMLYKLDWSKIDPVAVAQNMTCCIEKRMGIYPNVPNLVDDKTRGFKDGNE